jgi:hypothetical protein
MEFGNQSFDNFSFVNFDVAISCYAAKLTLFCLKWQHGRLAELLAVFQECKNLCGDENCLQNRAALFQVDRYLKQLHKTIHIAVFY